MSINFLETFYIRPKPSTNNRSKHLNPVRKYKAIAYEEIETNVKIKKKKYQTYRNILFYVCNDLNEFTDIDKLDCTIELFDHNRNKTITR